MRKLKTTLIASALTLLAATAFAQTGSEPGRLIGQQQGPGVVAEQDRNGRGPSSMMDPNMMGPNMMGPNMMGRGMMMMIMMDADGDGALSMDEMRLVHDRMFSYADADKDGRLTPEELGGPMSGMNQPGTQ